MVKTSITNFRLKRLKNHTHSAASNLPPRPKTLATNELKLLVSLLSRKSRRAGLNKKRQRKVSNVKPMASVTLQFLCLLALYVTLSKSCRAVRCKLLPSTPDISSEFQSLASENGVRIIYLSLKVGNSSYRPLDLKNVLFPEIWVWATSISEPMLSMGYDYDIFSLSLLNNQARSMDVHLIEEPSGCLADLNSSCQSIVVGKALLKNVTRKTSDKQPQRSDVVCVAMIGKAETPSDYINGNIEYHCCEADKGEKKAFEPPLQCDLSVKRSKWFTAFSNVLLVAAFIILFYCPAFPFALPEEIVMNIADEIKKEKEANDLDSREERGTTHGSDSSLLQNENETTVRQDDVPSVIPGEKDDKLAIPVDDTSPITCSVLLQKCATKLPGFQLSFNIKLVFLSYFVVPFVLYIVLLLTLALKGSYLQEAFRKQTAYLGGITFYLLYSLRGYDIIFILCFFLAPFVIVVSVKPKDLIENVRATYTEVIMARITYERTIGERICMNLLILQDKVHQIFSSSTHSYLNGLEKFLDFTIRAFLRRTQYSAQASRMKRLLCVLCVLILSLLGLLFGVVLGGIFLTIFLVKTVFFAVVLSPSANAMGFLWRKLINELDRHQCPPSDICAFIVTFLVFVDSNFAIIAACATVTFSCYLIIEVFGYTLMGLILNADIATPYAVFLLVVVTNVYLCYANLQHRYKEAKGIISKEWRKNKGLLLQDQTHLVTSNDDTIPKELFWFVCGEDLNAEYTILPIQTEMLHMFRNIICILAFLFLSLSTVIFFSDLYQISSLASSIAVFITGVIPKLFLQGFTKRKTLGGWEKIKITRQIEKAVKEYIDDVNNGERPRPMPEELTLRNMMYTNMPV